MLPEKQRRYTLDKGYLLAELNRGCCVEHCLLVIIGSRDLWQSWAVWGKKTDSEKLRDMFALLQEHVITDPSGPNQHGRATIDGRLFFLLYNNHPICVTAFACLHAMSVEMLRHAAKSSSHANMSPIAGTSSIHETEVQEGTKRAVVKLLFEVHLTLWHLFARITSGQEFARECAAPSVNRKYADKQLYIFVGHSSKHDVFLDLFYRQQQRLCTKLDIPGLTFVTEQYFPRSGELIMQTISLQENSAVIPASHLAKLMEKPFLARKSTSSSNLMRIRSMFVQH